MVEARGAVMLGDEMIDEASRKMAQAIVARGNAAGFASANPVKSENELRYMPITSRGNYRPGRVLNGRNRTINTVYTPERPSR